MFTTLAVVALSGLTAGKVAPGPVWLDDYRVAQTRVSEAGKPMAVFVGSGKMGWDGVIAGGLDTAVSKVLSEKFVCLYVDTTTAGGRRLATALQVGERGLVISDKFGSTQAYSANGTVAAGEAQRALLAYADPATVSRTEIVQAAPAPAPVLAPAPPPPGMPMGGPDYAGPGYVGGPGYMGGSGCGSTASCGGGGFSHGHGCCGMFGGGGLGFGHGMKGSGCPTASTGCGATGAHYASAGSCGGHSSCCGFGGFLSGCMGGWGHGGGWGGGCGGFMSHGGGCK